jgi:hypothetical protein
MTTSNIHLRCVNKMMMMRLKQEASTRNMSVNQFILFLLSTGLGLNNKPANIIHHDLDKFAGTWSKQEAKQFRKSIKDFEKIDEGLWK